MMSRYDALWKYVQDSVSPWGQRVIRFYDLDGYIIEVGEDMKTVINRFLDSGMTIEEVYVKMDISIASRLPKKESHNYMV